MQMAQSFYTLYNQGFGGPLSPNWHEFTINLQHQILQRMRDFGMKPVLPAFAGHIPKALVEKYPGLNFTEQTWNGFPGQKFVFRLTKC